MGIEVIVFGSQWSVILSGVPLLTVPCKHSAEHFARKLSEIRHLPHRNAMARLTEDFGFCEKAANQVFLALVDNQEISNSLH